MENLIFYMTVLHGFQFHNIWSKSEKCKNPKR